MDHTSPPQRDWYVYAEVVTAALLNGPQLAVIAGELELRPEVQSAQAAAGSIGTRYSVAARIRLRATDALTAKQEASTMLTTLLAAMDAKPAEVIALGLIGDS